MIVTKISTSTHVKDTALSLDITQAKDIETGSVNAEEMTYVLEAGQASFQLLTKGDVTQIKQLVISVTHRPTNFAGILVGFGSATYLSPITEAFVVTDLLVLSGVVADAVWVKNLDTVSDCTFNACLAGD